MIRIIALVLALATIAPVTAFADEPPPTPEQIEQAKKAFAEGKKLHEQGKHADAIEKFKESYRLSRNPLLLYNIGFTMDVAKEADMALFYYRRFLKEAPPEAEPRAVVIERVKVLEQQFAPSAPSVPSAPSAPTTTGAAAAVTPTAPDGTEATAARPASPEPKAPIQMKPPGTYTAADFEHQVVETAPPAKPLDVTAFVPEDSGFVVTLFYRTAGEGRFASRPMRWRYKELVGRIPAPKMIGDAVQYYIEVKDTTGALVTRSGRSTSPNLVNLEPGAPPRFYPDLTEDGEGTLSATEIRRRDEEDDPLNRDKKAPAEADPAKVAELAAPRAPGTGFRDVGSQRFTYAKWGATGAAVALVGLGIALNLRAASYADAIEDDAGCASPPCREYDDYARDLESAGERYQLLSNVSLGIGAAAAAVAGYLWIQELRARPRGELKASAKKAPAPQARAWGVAPVLGHGSAGFVGAAAARRF